MEYYSSMSPLMLSQPSSVESIKKIHQRNNVDMDDAALKKSSQDFESVLINYVLKALWQTVPESELSGENNAGMDTYTEIMHTALAQDIAAKGGLGVAPILYKQLIQNKGKP